MNIYKEIINKKTRCPMCNTVNLIPWVISKDDNIMERIKAKLYIFQKNEDAKRNFLGGDYCENIFKICMTCGYIASFNKTFLNGTRDNE